jgi:preprotein translocase subunit SecE
MTETRGSTAPTERGGPDREKKPGRVARVGLFYRQVIAELRKVIWPTRKELLTYTAVVLVFVSIMIAVVSLLDFGIGQGVLFVFG